MDRQHFLDLIGATNLIPGPNSTQMALHCGLQKGGMAVLVVILIAIYRLGQKALKGWQLGMIGAFVLLAALWGLSEIYAILAGGLS